MMFLSFHKGAQCHSNPKASWHINMSSTATIDGLKSCALQDETLKFSLDKLPSLAGASFLPLMFCGATAHVSDFPLWLLRASEDPIHILPVTEYSLIQGISFAVCVEKDRSKGSGVKVTNRSSPEEVYSKSVVDECFCWVRVFKHYLKRGLTLKHHLFFSRFDPEKRYPDSFHGSTHSKLFHYTYHLEDGHITYETHKENGNLYFLRHQVLVFGIVVISTHFENLGPKRLPSGNLPKHRYSANN